MSLSTAFNTAQSIFNNVGTQTSTVSKNMANKDNANYVRRAAVTSTTTYGAMIITTERNQDLALQRQTLTSNSQYSAQTELNNGLKRMSDIFGGNDYPSSPAKMLTSLQQSLNDYRAAPSNTNLASAVVNNAVDLANTLNDAAQQIQQVRADADKDIEVAVTRLNDLLKQFQGANDAVTTATAAGLDPNDALDLRDTILKQISDIVGVNTVRREPNDLILYTNEGTTLFEAIPRLVTFTPTYSYDASVTGQGIKIDGVPVTPGSGGNTSGQGSLAGLLQIRDQVAPVLQKQLDEVARGLITVFAERDSSTPAVVKPGLFTWSTGTVPPAGTIVPNLSGLISVNTAVIAASGGNPTLLRDGGINGAAFNKNPSNNAGYSATLEGYINGLTTGMNFDPAAQLDPSTGLMSFASKSIGWLEDIRSMSDIATDNKDAMYSRALEAYSNATGVSLDEELSLLLDLEHSYQASGKLMSAIDDMYQTLFNAAG
jgi:flagellar hook-associated protein 1 FlgK